MDRLDNRRILIYSHDTFGLGHLRRCRAIANELVGRFKGISVLILSGSPVVGGFEFRARVDYVRIPGVIKLKNGEYTSLKLHINLDQTMAIRESIIRHTAEDFDPHLFIVDKEPLGLEGEVARTLKLLKARGCVNVLGERDIIDSAELLQKEWQRKKVIPALEQLYDEIWVYGKESFYDPFVDLDISDSIREKVVHTGFIEREASANVELDEAIEAPFLLVTPGGGKDGDSLVDMLLSSYQQRQWPWPALVVLGPFMEEQQRSSFKAVAEQLPQVTILDSYQHMETLYERSAAVVAMGGYNTFCEIISFNKPALILPRFEPREEQLIRATQAARMGLAITIDPRNVTLDGFMAKLQELSDAPAPRTNMPDNFMSGLDITSERVMALLSA